MPVTTSQLWQLKLSPDAAKCPLGNKQPWLSHVAYQMLPGQHQEADCRRRSWFGCQQIWLGSGLRLPPPRQTWRWCNISESHTSFSVSPLLPVYLLPILLRELLKTLQTGPSAQPQCGSNCQKTCSNCDTTNWTQRGFCFLAMNQETVIMISAHAVSYAGKEKEAIRGTLRPELMAYKLRRWFHKLTTFWFLQGLKAIFHSKTGDYQNHVMILANPPRKRAHFSVMSWSRSNLILVCLLQPPSSNSWPSSWMVLQPAEANPGLSISFRNAVLILSLLKRK